MIFRVLCLLGITALGACAQLRFEPARLDLGQLFQMESRDLEFEVTNEGEHPIRARELEMACGCLKLRAGGGDLGPGATTTLKIELLTEMLEGDQRKLVNWGRGAAGGRVEITFMVEPDFVIRPAFLQLGEIRRGQAAEAAWIIEARAGLKAELVLLQAPPGATVTIEALDRVGDRLARWRIGLRHEVASDARPGAFEGVVLVEPRGARIALLQLNFAGHALGHLRCRPDPIDFGRVELGSPGRVTIQLESRDQIPFRILGYVTAGKTQMFTEPAAAAAKQEAEIVVKLGPALGPQRGFCELILDHPQDRRMRIAWRGRVVERKP